MSYRISINYRMYLEAFPSPFEVNGGGYYLGVALIATIAFVFPSPLEVTGVSYEGSDSLYKTIDLFPYPLEETRVSY